MCTGERILIEYPRCAVCQSQHVAVRQHCANSNHKMIIETPMIIITIILIIILAICLYQGCNFWFCQKYSYKINVTVNVLSPVYTFTIFSTIHHDSPRFFMVRKIGVNRGGSWRKVEIFSVTTIPVRMPTVFCKVSLRINGDS